METLISLRTQFVAPPSWTQLAFTTEMAYDKALANSESPGGDATLSFIYARLVYVPNNVP